LDATESSALVGVFDTAALPAAAGGELVATAELSDAVGARSPSLAACLGDAAQPAKNGTRTKIEQQVWTETMAALQFRGFGRR
jgi:SpoU rRNA methylase family enzyme